jgi:hypothetical protein
MALLVLGDLVQCHPGARAVSRQPRGESQEARCWRLRVVGCPPGEVGPQADVGGGVGSYRRSKRCATARRPTTSCSPPRWVDPCGCVTGGVGFFDPACTALRLTGVSPHDLRHTAASLAIRSGANVKAVQRLLGHASAAMTLDVYAGLFPDDLGAVADSLDALVPQMCHTAVVPPELERRETLGAGPKTASELRKLSDLKLVGPVGLEPTTRGLKVRCSAS